MLKAAYPVVKATVPDVPVLMAGLASTEGEGDWAGAADGLWVSRDYGTTWELINHIPQTAILRLGKVIVPLSSPPFVEAGHSPLVYASGEWLWAGTEGAGLWISPDNGTTWHFGGLPERAVFNVFFDPLHPRRLIAATEQGIFAVNVPDSTPGTIGHNGSE